MSSIVKVSAESPDDRPGAGQSKNIEQMIASCISGLIFQIVLFAFFFANIVVFPKRNNRNSIALLTHPQGREVEAESTYALHRLRIYFAWKIVWVIEYAQGGQGQVTTHEVFPYIFDGRLIFVAMAVFVSMRFCGHLGG